MMTEKASEKTKSTSSPQLKNTLNLVSPQHPTNTIRWPRSKQFINGERVITIELMIKEITNSNDWTTLATTLAKIIGVRKFRIHPKEGMIKLRFNQEQINLTKLQYILTNHGYDIKPASASEHTKQEAVFPPKSI